MRIIVPKNSDPKAVQAGTIVSRSKGILLCQGVSSDTDVFRAAAPSSMDIASATSPDVDTEPALVKHN